MTDPSPPPIARLLVVDDEEPLAVALRNTLEHQGYSVVAVTAPAEALKLLCVERFDLLLTDLQMPGMDGIALLQAALALDPHLVPIVMTGHGTIESAVEAMKAGALDYILKPFTLRVALPVISRTLAVRKLRMENEALHRRLEARTAELEAMNNELEAFSYSVSHDLRSPLRSIQGFATLLESDLGNLPEARLRELTSRICAGVERMNGLIDDLLRLARTTRTELRRTRVDLTAMAREVAAKLQAEAPERNVEWAIGEDLGVYADPGLMRLALENLLSNAWKYSSKVARSRIEVGREAGTNGGPVCYVRDNGAGFDMRYAERLFAPFQRLHSTKEFVGNGIGLATVQRIIHKHGGRIWAEAAPGQGATFRFTLPGE